MLVKVTNANNVWRIRDKYAGIEYDFQPNTTVSIPKEAAEHIFGYGLPESEQLKKMMRMGIANHPKGKELWGRVKIKPAGNIEPTGVVREAA